MNCECGSTEFLVSERSDDDEFPLAGDPEVVIVTCLGCGAFSRYRGSIDPPSRHDRRSA